MLKELKKVFEKRKYKLIQMLERKDISLEKKYEIYGAIQEIDNFLRAIDYYIEKEMKDF